MSAKEMAGKVAQMSIMAKIKGTQRMTGIGIMDTYMIKSPWIFMDASFMRQQNRKAMQKRNACLFIIIIKKKECMCLFIIKKKK